MSVALERTVKGVALLFVATVIVGTSGLRLDARPQAQVPVVSQDPAVQQQIEKQLAGAASVRLDPNARIASLNLTARPLTEILDAIAKAGGVTVRYAAGTSGLDTPATVTFSDQTVEDALRTTLKGRALTYLAMGSKVAFIHPDTPASREKYTATIRAFPLARAKVNALTVELNQVLKPTADGFRPMVLSASDSNTFVVRAIPEQMTWIAAWIAEHDKVPAL